MPDDDTTTPPESPLLSIWERSALPHVEPIPVHLSDDELRDFGLDLASTLQDIATQAREEETLKKELKAAMARLETRRDELAAALRRRTVQRDVEVVWERNYALGTARKIRLDTGEVITTRLLRDDERQPTLLPDVAAKAEEARVESSAP